MPVPVYQLNMSLWILFCALCTVMLVEGKWLNGGALAWLCEGIMEGTSVHFQFFWKLFQFLYDSTVHIAHSRVL